MHIKTWKYESLKIPGFNGKYFSTVSEELKFVILCNILSCFYYCSYKFTYLYFLLQSTMYIETVTSYQHVYECEYESVREMLAKASVVLFYVYKCICGGKNKV